MDYTELAKQWEIEENAAFQGWDFSHLDGRWDCPESPWDYKILVKSYLKDENLLIDMGTGGGEVLLSLNHPHNKTYVTEAYEPNFELCKKILAPLGINVVRTYNDERLDKLPFENNYFDFIINRHESFDLSEVNRVLNPGGYFFTQQVGSRNNQEFARMLNDDFRAEYPGHEIQNYINKLERLGFQIIIKDEAKYITKFFDVGALVYYAKIIEWEFPDFSVKTHFEKLCGCQREIEKNGHLKGIGHRFIIGARKL